MIPGLRYVPGYIDADLHESLLTMVDAEPWQGLGGRRVQIYGYSYDLARGGAYRIGDLPAWAQDLAVRLRTDGLMADVADQLIANDYSPGQGIPAHVDAPLFTDTIVAVSLGSSAVMQCIHSESGETFDLLLEPMSALVMSGDARYQWKHSIPARAVDVWMGREHSRSRRVSLTLRKMRNHLRPTSSSD